VPILASKQTAQAVHTNETANVPFLVSKQTAHAAQIWIKRIFNMMTIARFADLHTTKTERAFNLK
jgi:hypothetical protein